MLVQWTTVERGRPAVRWGLHPGEHTEVALAAGDTYTRGDLCGGASAAIMSWPKLIPISVTLVFAFRAVNLSMRILYGHPLSVPPFLPFFEV